MDKIVINVSGQADLDSTIKKLLELGYIDEKNAKTFLANSKAGQKEIEKMGTAYKGLKDSVNGYLQALPGAQHVQQVANLAKGINATSTSTGLASKAMNIFKLSMLAVPIVAFVAAIAGLISYFKKTDEGAAKLSGIMGALGAVVDIVTGYLAKFGQWLFNAASSTKNFKEALKDLGDAIIENVINRFKALLVYGEAIQLLFEGKFTEAALKATDATIQLSTGITDATSKMAAIGEEMSKAAKEAYALALAWDELEDAERNYSFIAAQNHKLITNLIIQAKNRTLSEKERLAIIDKASAAETKALQGTLDLAKQRAALIIRENQLKRDGTEISNKAAMAEVDNILKTGKLLEQKGQLSDDEATKEVDAINRIIQIQEESANLQDRLENRRDLIVQAGKAKREAEEKKREEEEKKRLAAIIKHREDVLAALDSSFQDEDNQYKANADKILQAIGQDYMDRKITKEQYEKQTNEAILKIQRDQVGREIDVINQKLAVEGLEYDKRIELEKELAAAKEKLYKMDVDAFTKANDEKDKADKKLAADKKNRDSQLKDTAIQNINTLTQAYGDGLKQKNDNELAAIDKQTSDQLASLEKRNKLGLLSDAALGQAKANLEKQRAAKELQVKKRAAQQEKNIALFQIGIATATAVIKQLAVTPLPFGLPLVAAILATGAIQAAVVASKPLPGFKKGGYTGDGGTSDAAGIVHKREFVMPAEKTAQYRSELQAMYDGRYSKDHRNPIRLERSLSDIRHDGMADNIFKSIMANEFSDTRIVDAIKRNNKTNIANSSELANAIANKIADRNSEKGLYA